MVCRLMKSSFHCLDIFRPSNWSLLLRNITNKQKLYKVSECECFTFFTSRIKFLDLICYWLLLSMFSGYILQIYFFGSYSAKRETDIYRMQKLLLSGSCYSAKRETKMVGI